MEQDRYNSNYNEVILDGFHWNKHLPYSIEAVITTGPEVNAWYRDFLNAYGLTPESIPLIEFHTTMKNPFMLAASYSQGAHGTASSDSVNAQPNPSDAHAVHTGDVSTLGYGR